MSENDSYQKLIDHHKKWIFGSPGPELLHEVFELMFTPNEAEFLSKIPFNGNGIGYKANYLSKKLKIPIDELIEKLDDFARRGVVYRYHEGKAIRYANGDLNFMFYRGPWWAGIDNELHIKLAPLVNKYYEEAFGPMVMGQKTIMMRAVPINQTIEDTRTIMPYEDVVKHLDQYEYYSVGHCGCRRRHNVDPAYENSKYPTETCLHFGALGRYAVENGISREITKEETLEILKQAADAGLVHGFENTIDGGSTVCNCDPDYCFWFDSMLKMPDPVPRGMQKSNYIREINEEKCVKCGLCAKVCPMEAFEFKKEEKELIFHEEKCVGCGVCAHQCPKEAIYMKHREGEADIPKSGIEFGTRWLKERGRDLVKFGQDNSF